MNITSQDMIDTAKPNWWPHRWNTHNPEEFVVRCRQATPEQLFEMAEEYIWLSAYANNNLRSDYHWMVDAIYSEFARRNDTKGYSRAWNSVVEENR